MSEVWDDPDLKMSNDFVKFEAPGDSVVGNILSIRKHTFDDGKVAAQVLLETDDGEKTLTVGQIQLRAKFNELRPGIGDRIKVTYVESEKRGGGKTLKHFDVKVQKGVAPAPKPAVDDDEAPF